MSDPPGGLSFDFGTFRLFAAHGMGRHFRPVVMFSGAMPSARRIAAIEFELPEELASAEQGMAMLTYYLDRQAVGELLSQSHVQWLELGRQHKHLLPWNRSKHASAD